MVAYIVMGIIIAVTPALVIARYLWIVRRERSQAAARQVQAAPPRQLEPPAAPDYR